jgi:hypothetical protein
MTPMLGIMASSISGSKSSSYESIATVTVGSGGSSSVAFTSIPSTYKHLQIRATYQTASNNWVSVRCNSDSTYTNYRTHYLEGSGAAASAGTQQITSITGLGLNYTQSTGGSIFDVSVMDILDYADSNKYKVSRTFRGCDNNGSGYIGLQSALWINTAAVTRLDLISASIFSEYSSFALYGIKG